MSNSVDDLSKAALDAYGETSGYPARVARSLYHYLARDGEPYDVVRELIVGILSELEVQWDRTDDAPTWPDD